MEVDANVRVMYSAYSAVITRTRWGCQACWVPGVLPKHVFVQLHVHASLSWGGRRTCICVLVVAGGQPYRVLEPLEAASYRAAHAIQGPTDTGTET